jgi:hypothetical protein
MKINYLKMLQMYKIIYFIIVVLVFSTGCTKDSSVSSGTDNNGGTDIGTGGSLARFTITNDHLFTVDNEKLKSYNLADPTQPKFVAESNVGFGIETIFAGKDNILFLGSTTGMYIYDVTEPMYPGRISNYQHIYSCDPVVANDKFAFVTLSSTSRCGRNTNELQVVDISNLELPFMVRSYKMDNPKGLGISNNNLFVCDDGLKVYDATNVGSLKLLHKFGIPAIDIIPMDTLLMVIADDGLHQYKYKDGNVTLLSKLLINK